MRLSSLWVNKLQFAQVQKQPSSSLPQSLISVGAGKAKTGLQFKFQKWPAPDSSGTSLAKKAQCHNWEPSGKQEIIMDQAVQFILRRNEAMASGICDELQSVISSSPSLAM